MPRVARKAKNQALFREVNERIAEFSSDSLPDEPGTFICECSSIGCSELLHMSAREYAKVRDDPTTFLVARGHQDPAHETVVSEHDGYLIARNKPGLAEQIARKTV